ncbi:MAG: WG repeat-containing protein [Prevotella sp.]|jgi:hypothetical protein|nr:WG repeat-containing protein [Prevotella sp.]
MKYRVTILVALLVITGSAVGQKRQRIMRGTSPTTVQQQQPQVQPQPASVDDEWKGLYDDTRPCRASSHVLVLNGPFIGLCTADGEEIIKPGKYDAVIDCNLSEHIFLLKNNLWGLYDLKQRKEVIPCEYGEDAIIVQQLYQEEINGPIAKAPVRDVCNVNIVGNGFRQGVYDVKQGRLIVPIEYQGCLVFERVGNLFPLFDIPTGKSVTEGSTSLGYEGIYDVEKQKQITPIKYGMIFLNDFLKHNYCRVFSNRDPTIQHDEGCGLIDHDGNEILAPKYTTLVRLDLLNEESDIFIIGEGGQRKGDWGDNYTDLVSDRYALYDAGKKTFLTGFDYKRIEPLKDAIVVWEGKQMNDSTDLEGLTAFCTLDDRWGYMDAKGKIVVPAEYEAVTRFEGGVAQVTKNGVTSMLANPLKGTKLTLANATAAGKTVDSAIPETGKKDENLFAYIFATENYNNLKGADYALNDGKVFAEYCRKTLGVPEQQVHYYEDATFGNLTHAIHSMQSVAEAFDGDAKIIFYFAGLGATDSKTRQRYLLPADATLETMNATGYRVDELQKALNSMNTTYTLAIIDAPFANVDRNGKMLESARGIQIKPQPIIPAGKTILCVSSTDTETAYASKTYGHGLFTFGLLQELQSTKGEDTLKDMIDKATSWTQQEAVKEFKQAQNPQHSISSEMAERWTQYKF